MASTRIKLCSNPTAVSCGFWTSRAFGCNGSQSPSKQFTLVMKGPSSKEGVGPCLKSLISKSFGPLINTLFVPMAKIINQRTDSPKSLLVCKVLMECCVSSMQTQYMQRR